MITFYEVTQWVVKNVLTETHRVKLITYKKGLQRLLSEVVYSTVSEVL